LYCVGYNYSLIFTYHAMNLIMFCAMAISLSKLMLNNFLVVDCHPRIRTVCKNSCKKNAM